MANGTYVTVLLYGQSERCDNFGMLIVNYTDSSTKHTHHIKRREEVPVVLDGPNYDYSKSSLHLKILPNVSLPGGELIIESPVWLRNKE